MTGLANLISRAARAATVLLVLLTSPALAQTAERAKPVTGPDVTTIGGIAPNARVNVRSGPAVVFPSVGSVGYGTRVSKGICLGGGSARWCQIRTMDGRLSGYVSARFLVEGAPETADDNLTGGPDFWVVRGLPPGDRLNVRRDPSAKSPALATLQEREIVRNLGCRMVGTVRWCRIRSTVGMDVTGWVAGRFLRESGPPPAIRPPQGGGSGGISVVSGLAAGDFLNVRSRASTQGTVVARLAPGAQVRNLGCEQKGQTRWCQIRTLGGVEVTGWVNGRYLR